MARFHELIDSIGVAEDGVSIAYPETFLDDIRAAYDEDLAGPAAAIEVRDAEIAELKAQILQLQAHNYELMTQVPAVETPSGEQSDSEDGSDSEDEESDLDKIFSD